MKNYTLSSCENLMNKYLEMGGEITNIRDGVLGLGTVICACKGYKTAVINEVFVSAWCSSHTVRFYNKLPKTIQHKVDLLT